MVLEQDFQLAPIKIMANSKQKSVHMVLRVGEELLTSTESIVWRLKEYFEDLINPTNMHSEEEAISKDFKLSSVIIGVEVSGSLKCSGSTMGVDELLKAVDVTGLFMVDTSLQHCVDIGDLAFGVADRCGSYPFQEGGPVGVFQLPGITLLSLPGKVLQGVGEESPAAS